MKLLISNENDENTEVETEEKKKGENQSITSRWVDERRGGKNE